MIKKISILLVFCVLACSLYAVDYDLLDALLEQHTTQVELAGINTVGVNYQALKEDKRFNKLISEFEKTYPQTIVGEDEKLAFWINAYNLCAIKIIASNFPTESIKATGDLFHPFDNEPAVKIGGKTYSLSQIKLLIRHKFKEPLIHTALSNTAISSPDLRQEAYRSQKLREQLKNQLENFLVNPAKGFHLDTENKTLYLSSIFTWDAEDFKKNGGIINFLELHVPAEVKTFLDNNRYKIKYFDYKWDVNQWSN